jgi:hypothetical protein
LSDAWQATDDIPPIPTPTIRDVADKVRAQVIDEVVAVADYANVKAIPVGVWNNRTQRWTVAHLRPEASIDEGTFRLVDAFHNGLQVAEYYPERGATHVPIGPEAMSDLGLRDVVRHPDEAGD